MKSTSSFYSENSIKTIKTITTIKTISSSQIMSNNTSSVLQNKVLSNKSPVLQNMSKNTEKKSSMEINSDFCSSLFNTDDCSFLNMKKYVNKVKEDTVIIEDLPKKIEGTYKDDYNIVYIDDIIRKKLKQEKYTCLDGLKTSYKNLDEISKQSQTYITRENTLASMKKLIDEILSIENGTKLSIYESETKDIISAYKKYYGMVKTILFDKDDEDEGEIILDDETEEKFYQRSLLIEKYLEIAAKYIPINIIKINNTSIDVCQCCGVSLSKVMPNDDGCIRCPAMDCQTEHNMIITHKICKDGSRVTVANNNDDSIDNFMRAFIRYQGLQSERPPESIYSKLDDYFINLGQPSSKEIMNLPLNEKGKRGETDHKMLWIALSNIGYSEYYKHSNYIGHIYWGWELPKVMHLKELIVYHYNETQKVYYQIPIEERKRDSSLGTSYRLWRHLQLAGHKCHFNEFKIVTNNDSLHCHDQLWKRMVEETDDPNIYYIQ